ncbi:UNVERIFIED_CONTAM: putative UDP-rhamnose:rhamnosyltransferase 1 [Sesamum latifolium]|uniref:UDP-rhamnose:rhamnosyltransferase 1 n=1 Tax=Sesamum latifolium TaxID=2727402 RepID=A0AAW2U583_9LAMI
MSRDGSIHVAMLPWSAFGHLIPFLQLSIALAKSGIHSLPESAEATVDIPADKIQYLKLACDLLQEPVRDLVSEKSPHWIIVDFFHHWAVDIAQDFNIPIVRFCVVSAATVVFFGAHKLPAVGDKRLLPQSWTLPPEYVDFSSTVAYKKHEAEEMHAGYFGQNASGMPDGPRAAKIIQACKAIAVRTCPEFEADYLKLYEKFTGKPVFTVGFLPPEKMERRSPTSNEEPWSGIFQWLDKQNPRSVVFVGFGSECKLNKDQIHEIAHGVEISGLPFLWALRKPDWADDDEDSFPAGSASGQPREEWRTSDGRRRGRHDIAKALEKAMVLKEGEEVRVRARKAGVLLELISEFGETFIIEDSLVNKESFYSRSLELQGVLFTRGVPLPRADMVQGGC